MRGSAELFVAVFGDIHGRIALMYTLASCWERETGRTLSGLLQVGDMNAFPETKRIPSRILRQAKAEPDLLGYQSFCRETGEGARYLGRAEAPVCLFLRGNQEDFAYLSDFVKPSFVDPWRRLRYLPDGSWARLGAVRASMWDRRELLFPTETEDAICVGVLGGIPPEDSLLGRKASRKSKSRRGETSIPPDCFDPAMLENAFVEAPSLDVLLTHEGPKCAALESGSVHLARLAERLRPRFHFFGHHYFATGPCEGPGGTTLVGFDHVGFERSGRFREASWGVLRVQGKELSFTMANSQTMPWLDQVRADSYRQIMPL